MSAEKTNMSPVVTTRVAGSRMLLEILPGRRPDCRPGADNCESRNYILNKPFPLPDNLGMKNEERESNDAGLVNFLQRFGTDEACRKHFEATLWPNGPTCPKCASTKAYPIKCETARPGLYKCGACKKQYTVTVGTLFEGSHIPLPTWFAAIYLMNASKKGMSAHQLHRTLNVTYKTAWFMCHRVRAGRSDPKPRKLRGKVEVEETYVGGKSKFHGRSTEKKTPVLALV